MTRLCILRVNILRLGILRLDAKGLVILVITVIVNETGYFLWVYFENSCFGNGY